MTAEEILKNYGCINSNDELDKADILLLMKEWGDARFIEGRDKALEWAVENAEVEDYYEVSNGTINTKSILSGKTSNDLQP